MSCILNVLIHSLITIWVVEHSASWLVIARLLLTYRGTKTGKSGPVLTAKIGPARMILAAKVIQGTSLGIFLPKLVQPDRVQSRVQVL